MRRALGLHLAAAISALSLVFAGQAAAVTETTVGQTFAPEALANCAGSATVLQTGVSSGNPYTIPTAGTITSWSFQFGSSTFEKLDLKVARATTAGKYLFVGEDEAGTLTPNAIDHFPAAIAVEAGDVIGFHFETETIPCGTLVEASGNAYSIFAGNPSVGAELPPLATVEGARFPVTATVTTSIENPPAALPSNVITIGKVKLDKKRGTAKLPVTVPGSGTLTLTGKGVVKQTKTPTTAATVNLLVKSKGKQKKKLNNAGKVKVKVTVTYTPMGGTANSQGKGLVLKKSLH